MRSAREAYRRTRRRSAWTRRIASLAGALCCLPLLAACGGSKAPAAANPTKPSTTTTSARASRRPKPQPTVDIYAGMPLHGKRAAQGQAVVNGIRLAVSQAGGRAGDFRIRFKALDDTAAPPPKKHHRRRVYALNLKRTAANALSVATDPNAVFYIGDLDSDATKVSAPILNQAGIPQITPGSPYVGLTSELKGVTGTGEPAIYQAHGVTLVRLVPDDEVEASALLVTMQRSCGQRIVALYQDNSEDTAIVTYVAQAARVHGLDVVATHALTGKTNVTSLMHLIGPESPNCFVIAAPASSMIVQLTNTLHDTYLHDEIFGSSSLCNPSWTNSKLGGVSAQADAEMYCVSPILPVARYRDVSGFIRAYTAKYRVAPSSGYAVLGYVAANIAIDAIRELGKNGNDRANLLEELFAHEYTNQLGDGWNFSDLNGDSSLDTYGLFGVMGGDPKLKNTFQAT